MAVAHFDHFLMLILLFSLQYLHKLDILEEAHRRRPKAYVICWAFMFQCEHIFKCGFVQY